MNRHYLWILILVAAVAQPAAAATIGHSQVDLTPSLSQEALDEIGQQRWFFAHASVGANMVGGMRVLNLFNPSEYLLVGTNAGIAVPPPSTTQPGLIYESYRGNPGWADKFTEFEESVRDLGWRSPAVDVVMNKLCFEDDQADASVYLASMETLEAEFPGTVFIYTTMPLRAQPVQENVRAGAYNETVRDFCSAKGKLLFDVADIEAHDPAGNEIVFDMDGADHQMMYTAYTDDGGHLNELGRERMSLGWYAVAATLVSQGVSSVGTTPTAAAAHIASVAPNPFNPATVVRWSVAVDTQARLSVIDLRGRLVAELHDGPVAAGDYDTPWRGLDTNGLAVGSGVYLLRLEAGGEVSNRSMTLVR